MQISKSDERTQKLKNVLSHRQKKFTVVLENINDPHNVSACLRSCDSVGIFDVYFLYHGTQKFPKLSSITSASADKWLNYHKFTSVKECYDVLRSQGKKIYTTHMAQEAVSIYDLDLTQDCALVFGNEHSGITDEALELADGNFLIPQVGMVQSLNISVSCAVSVYEVFRQRLNAGMYNNQQLSDSEYNLYLNQWLIK